MYLCSFLVPLWPSYKYALRSLGLGARIPFYSSACVCVCLRERGVCEWVLEYVCLCLKPGKTRIRPAVSPGMCDLCDWV